MTGCAIIPSDTAYLSGILGYIDCQARTIGGQGYLALTAPASQVSLLLTVMLTIFAALFGYRLLLGHAPNVREGVLTLARIGFVLALATNWNAYRILAYDVALDAPAELAAEVGGYARLPGTAGLMNGHLDAVNQMFQSVNILGVGGPVSFDIARLQPPPLFSGFDTFALGASRTAFLTGAIGGLGAMRLLAGLLLALGPLFFGFLLFDATRGLFLGWLKGLVGAAFGSLLVAITLGVEIALLEPWLSFLIQRRNAGDTILAAPNQLLALSLVFAAFLLVSVVAGLRLGQGVMIAVPTSWKSMSLPWQPAQELAASSPMPTPQAQSLASAEISRASAIAETIRRADQRQGASARSGIRTISDAASGRDRMGQATGGHARRVVESHQARRRFGSTASAGKKGSQRVKSGKDLDSYFAASDSWAADRSAELLRSRRDAWRIAMAAVAVALLEGLALVFLIPLEKIVPYTLLVDRHTGYIELLKPLDPVSVSPDGALTQSLLSQYVIAREGFDINSIRRDYQKVALWSADSARQQYLSLMPATNPDSPLARYPRSTIVDIQVKSVTSLSKERAMVRFDAIRQDQSGQPQQTQPEVAVVDFRFSGEPLSMEERLVNPLRFQVVRYRRSMEALPTTLTPSAGSALSAIGEPAIGQTRSLPGGRRP